jgi:hypothetical protein
MPHKVDVNEGCGSVLIELEYGKTLVEEVRRLVSAT